MLLMAGTGALGAEQRKRLRLRNFIARAGQVSKWVAGLALCGLLGWGGYVGYQLVSQSAYFRLRTIDIAGHTALSREDILYLLAIPPQASVLQLDLARMGARLERHPHVHAVRLRRQFPDTLQVAIRERVPRLIVVSGTQRMVIDQDGVVLRAVIPTQDEGLTQLQLRRKTALAPGMRLSQSEVPRALELMRAYAESEVAGTLRVISMTVQDSGSSLWTIAPYAFNLRVGEGQIDDQLKRLPPVLRYLEHRELSPRIVDVSYRKRVVVIPET